MEMEKSSPWSEPTELQWSDVTVKSCLRESGTHRTLPLPAEPIVPTVARHLSKDQLSAIAGMFVAAGGAPQRLKDGLQRWAGVSGRLPQAMAGHWVTDLAERLPASSKDRFLAQSWFVLHGN